MDGVQDDKRVRWRRGRRAKGGGRRAEEEGNAAVASAGQKRYAGILGPSLILYCECSW